MKSLISLELRRALGNNYRFWLAFHLGTSLALLAAWQNYQGLEELLIGAKERWYTADYGYSSISAFTYWMQIQPATYFSGLFYSLWPLLASITYSWSLVSDAQTGVRDLYATKYGRKPYITSKLVAIGLSAAIVTVGPLVINLIACLCFAPANSLLATDVLFHGVNSASLVSTFLFSNPWVYVIVWLLIDSVIAALWAILVALIAYKAKKIPLCLCNILPLLKRIDICR